MKQPRILILDLYPKSALYRTLQEILESSLEWGKHLYKESIDDSNKAFSKKNLTRIISYINPDIIFLVLPQRFLNQLEVFIQSIYRELLDRPIILVIEDSNSDEIISLLKLGITDFITPPLNKINVLPRIWRLIEYKKNEGAITHALKERMGLQQLIGESPAFISEIKKIPMIAKCDATVLISGETGTGKELCARALHYLSPRSDKPFIPVNCGAIPLELVENELFGHIKGSFTNAFTSQPGLIHEADGGTLFLDDIDCFPLSSQAKLLRFLQGKEYKRIGSSKLLKSEVWVIAATNIDLEKAIKEGKFRKDLYYRLNAIPLILPPLRERKEDIHLLAHHFLTKYATKFNKQIKCFTPDTIQKLMIYEWPGNVRELEHMIERTVVLSEDKMIRCNDIILSQSKSPGYKESFKEAKVKVIEQFERSYIQKILFVYNGNISKASHAANKNRRAFWELIRKHHIDVQNCKS